MSGLVDVLQLQLALEALQLFGVLVVLIAARAGEFVAEAAKATFDFVKAANTSFNEDVVSPPRSAVATRSL
jgi:hypothetical protein